MKFGNKSKIILTNTWLLTLSFYLCSRLPFLLVPNSIISSLGSQLVLNLSVFTRAKNLSFQLTLPSQNSPSGTEHFIIFSGFNQASRQSRCPRRVLIEQRSFQVSSNARDAFFSFLHPGEKQIKVLSVQTNFPVGFFAGLRVRAKKMGVTQLLMHLFKVWKGWSMKPHVFMIAGIFMIRNKLVSILVTIFSIVEKHKILLLERMQIKK